MGIEEMKPEDFFRTKAQKEKDEEQENTDLEEIEMTSNLDQDTETAPEPVIEEMAKKEEKVEEQEEKSEDKAIELNELENKLEELNNDLDVLKNKKVEGKEKIEKRKKRIKDIKRDITKTKNEINVLKGNSPELVLDKKIAEEEPISEINIKDGDKTRSEIIAEPIKEGEEKLLQVDKLLSLYKDRGRFLFHLENLKMGDNTNENELANTQTKISAINYSIKNLCRGMTKSDIERLPENKRREIEEIMNAIKEGRMDYGKLAVREKNKMKIESQTPEKPETGPEIIKEPETGTEIEEKEPRTTREVIEQLGLLEELEMFESNLKARVEEKADIENYIDEKIKNGEEITHEDEARRDKASEEVQMADINVNTARGVGASLEVEKDTEDEDRILNKKLKLQDLLWKQYNVLGKIKGIEDKNIEKLSSEKRGIVKRYSSAVVNKGLEVFKRLIYEDSDQQATEPKKKSKFDWLKEKLRIGGKKEVGKIEEINEEISNVTKLEDLAKVADFIEEKCGIKFKRSFKKSLEDEKSEILRGNYNSAVEVVNSSEEGSQKDALIKFYEKLDELLKEKEKEDNSVDIIEDLLPIEEIEPTELTPETPEIETLETEEISEEIKGKIREGLVELKERDRTVFDNLEGFINSFLSSEESFGKDFSKVQFNTFIKGDMDLEYEDIENIKTNDFLDTLREIYNEVKEEEDVKTGKEDEGKETISETEWINKEDVEKEINVFLKKDELNIDNVENLESLENLLGLLETKIKNTIKKEIPNELKRNNLTYFLESETISANSKIYKDIVKDNFRRARTSIKYFEIDSLKKYYLKLLDKVEELYNAEMKKDKKEKGEMTEEIKRKIKKRIQDNVDVFESLENSTYFNDNYLKSEHSLKEDSWASKFSTILAKTLNMKFEEIENINTGVFMTALKEIYEEVKSEKEKLAKGKKK